MAMVFASTFYSERRGVLSPAPGRITNHLKRKVRENNEEDFFCRSGLALLFSFGACGQKEPEQTKDEKRIVIGDYEAVYQKAEIMQDYDGDDAIVVTYQFTNHSKEAASFGWSIFYVMLQDGVELETSTIFVDEDSFEALSDSEFTEVQPGETVEVKSTCKLRDTQTPVEIQFSDLMDENTAELTIDLSTVSK